MSEVPSGVIGIPSGVSVSEIPSGVSVPLSGVCVSELPSGMSGVPSGFGVSVSEVPSGVCVDLREVFSGAEGQPEAETDSNRWGIGC